MKWLATASSRKSPATRRRSGKRAKRAIFRAFQTFAESTPSTNKGISGNIGIEVLEETATNRAETSNMKATGVAGASRKLLQCGIDDLNR
jgi:hypothetical protein